MVTTCHHIKSSVFKLLKKLTCHSFAASVCGSFAHHSGFFRLVPGFVEGDYLRELADQVALVGQTSSRRRTISDLMEKLWDWV